MAILSILISLFILEVLLSIDNALVNATLAEALPHGLRPRAIRIGIILGAVFRVTALLLASFIIHNPWLKILGGLYLVYLMMEHAGKILDDKGHDVRAKKSTFKGVIVEIALADIVFSLDNVVSAVSFSDNIAIVMLGVGIGVMSMLFITPMLATFIEKYKGMPYAAYVIVGLIGFFLLFETLGHVHITEVTKFCSILMVVLFTLWYEHSSRVRLIVNPLLRKGQYSIGFPLTVLRELKGVMMIPLKRKD